MLWLFDSRMRGMGDKRLLLRLPETEQNVEKIWRLVLAAENCEWDDYACMAEGPWFNTPDPILPAEVFNDYWAPYGWCLCMTDEDSPTPDDCIDVTDIT